MELKRWRKLNEVSLSALSEKTGGAVSVTSLCNYELGKRFPHPRHIELIRKATEDKVTAADMHCTWTAKNRNLKPKASKKKKQTIKGLVAGVAKSVALMPIGVRERAILAVVNALMKSMK